MSPSRRGSKSPPSTSLMNDELDGLLLFGGDNGTIWNDSLIGRGVITLTARLRSAQDGMWRIILTPNDPFGRMLSDTIEALSGSGEQRLESGGKVTVTSREPFGDRDAILIIMGKWSSCRVGNLRSVEGTPQR